MAHLIGETLPGPLTLPQLPPSSSQSTQILSSGWWRSLVLGRLKGPGESPGTSIKVPNLSVYSSII